MSKTLYKILKETVKIIFYIVLAIGIVLTFHYIAESKFT